MPLTIWLQSAAFPQVGPFASFGQRSAKVAHPLPTLQIKGEQKTKEQADTPESFLSSNDQTLMDRYVKKVWNTVKKIITEKF